MSRCMWKALPDELEDEDEDEEDELEDEDEDDEEEEPEEEGTWYVEPRRAVSLDFSQANFL